MDNKRFEIGSRFIDQLNIYQSANSDNESIKKNFIIRKNEFHTIINSLKNKKEKDPLQHELILGRRGSGKSTLLKRIQIEIEENTDCNKKYLAINLAEEQAGIYRLFDLWQVVLDELVYKFKFDLEIKDYNEFKSDQEFTRYLYDLIHEICIKERKKIILLLDNFDRIIENFTDDGNLLREILINYNDVQIIAGSTRMDEHFWKYDKPFYEFFRRHRLEILSSEEINQLIEHWSETLQIPQLKDFVNNNQGKVENIRILTDGLPRTLQFFIQILLQDSQLYGYEYLRKVMDNVTPLYQERLNSLTPQLRKIVLEMAFIWEASSTKQLVEKCRMESKLISANLKTLVNKGVVDKIETNKKNHLYRVSERFFNMWIIITQGNPDQKRKAKWLSIFLENWYDACDFKKLTDNHLNNLSSEAIGFNQALIFSKALSQSKYITTNQRDKIIEYTQKLNSQEQQNSLLELPKPFVAILNDIEVLMNEGNLIKAIELTESIENEEDGVKFSLLGELYDSVHDYKKAKKNYLLAIEKGNLKSTNNLAILYFKRKSYREAEKYFKKAIALKFYGAYNNIALLYEKEEKYDLAEKNYILAINNDQHDSLYNLGLLYDKKNMPDLAEKYYLLAIDTNIIEALNNLAMLYYINNIKKEKSLEYIKRFNVIEPNSITRQPEIIIEIWNGVFSDVENRIVENFKLNNFEGLDVFIIQLLVQQQNNIVLNLFRNYDFSEELKDRYLILYYTVLKLNDSKRENLDVIIPPELTETVYAALKTVRERQKFYGYIK